MAAAAAAQCRPHLFRACGSAPVDCREQRNGRIVRVGEAGSISTRLSRCEYGGPARVSKNWGYLVITVVGVVGKGLPRYVGTSILSITKAKMQFAGARERVDRKLSRDLYVSAKLVSVFLWSLESE